MHTRRGLAATLATLALCSGAAEAQRFYIGASGGTTRIDSGYPGQVTTGYAAFENGIVTPSEITAEAVGRSGRVFAGLRISDVFAIEADYTKLGEIEAGYLARNTPPGFQDAFSQVRWDFRAQAHGLALVAHVHLRDDLQFFGRAGMARTRMTPTFNGCAYRDGVGLVGCTEFRYPDVTRTRPVAGVGLDWRFTPRAALRASWDRYFGVGEAFDANPIVAKWGEFDIDYFALGATYSF